MTASNLPSLNLGPLPVEMINRTLGTELEPGSLRLSSQAHRHMFKDHGEDYAVCIAALQSGAVQAPTFIGQDPKHARNFVVVKRIASTDDRALLVAIGLEPDAKGDYRVRSSYLIDDDDVDRRRQAGRLHIPKP